MKNPEISKENRSKIAAEAGGRRHFSRRRGIGTLEVVIIIAVLLSVAMVFRQALTTYATNLIETVFNDQNVIDDLAVE